MALKTPPLNARGVFKLRTPWTAPATAIYQCIAIRSFADFTAVGKNAFETVYVPKGLTQADFQADLAQGANIITLSSREHPLILVPDTYIEEFPDIGGVAYKHLVLSASLGPIPDSTDLEFLKSQMAGLISDVIGVTPTVNLHAVPHTGMISESEHQTLETARQAAITLRKTDRAKLLEAQALIQAQAAKIAGLEEILRQNDLIPE